MSPAGKWIRIVLGPLLAGWLAAGSARAAPAPLTSVGPGGFDQVAPGFAAGDPALEFRFGEEAEPAAELLPPAGLLPISSDSQVWSAPAGGLLGAAGLTHYDQRTADGGNQFSIEPPDQALCVGNGFAIEAVNLAIRLRDAATNTPIGGTTSLNRFFGLPSAFNRSLPAGQPRFGPFLSDPKCLYDMDTRRFFVTILELEVNPVTNAFTGPTSLLIAVSKTRDPRDGFAVFRLATTNDGSNGITHPGCPCFGDQPLIGLDRHGLFISTNEFPVFADGFNGAQIYGISKLRLAFAAAGFPVSVPVALLNAGALPTPDPDGIWYTVQPAKLTPNDDDFEYEDENARRRGVEYFLSALEFAGVPDNRVALWAVTNTMSLHGDAPKLGIQVKVLDTHTAYVSPPRSVQKPSAATPAPRRIDGGDDRMQQVVKFENTIYGSLTTAIAGTPVRSGVAYWGIKPRWVRGALGGTVRFEGLVSVAGNYLQRPSVAVNRHGKGLIAFSLIGPDFYPSAAFVRFDADRGALGPVIVAGAGVAPDIGFSGAPTATNPSPRQRWGDYSAAADDKDNVWAAAEYIPVEVFPVPGQLANWGTFIWRLGQRDD